MTVCATCGRDLSNHPMDLGCELPDDVWNLPPSERAVRAWFDSNLAVLDGERHFIRGVLFVPVPERGDSFGWGLWAEVSQRVFNRYIEVFEGAGPEEPWATGFLANSPPPYESLLSHPLRIEFRPLRERPLLHLDASEHVLWYEQRYGITSARLHEILEPYGGESPAGVPS